MIKVKDLREKKQVFILHGISIRGAHFNETGQTYSILENFGYTFSKANRYALLLFALEKINLIYIFSHVKAT